MNLSHILISDLCVFLFVHVFTFLSIPAIHMVEEVSSKKFFISNSVLLHSLSLFISNGECATAAVEEQRKPGKEPGNLK